MIAHFFKSWSRRVFVMQDIVIYKAIDGHIEMDVNLANDTVWLSLSQLSSLFGRDKSVVSRHIGNIFKNKELSKDSVIAKFATTASDGKQYQVDYYNLDLIISVGYRVNSKEGVRFRQWATGVLKNHIIKGYTLREKRIAEKGSKELQQSIELLQRTLTQNNLVNEIGAETIQLIMSYAKTWHMLFAYDEDELKLPTKSKHSLTILDYDAANKAISALRADLASRNEASALFGNEREYAFQGILGNIEQT